MMKTKLLVLAMAVMAGLWGCKKEDTPPASIENEPSPPQTESNTPDGAAATEETELPGVTWVKNGPVTLEDGKVYVIEFWATWCPPCRESIPHLTQVQKAMASQDVTIIGLSNEKLDTVKDFVAQQGDKMDYSVGVDSEGKLGKKYMEAYNINGIPHAFVIGKDGEVAWHGHPMGGLEGAIAEALNAK